MKFNSALKYQMNGFKKPMIIYYAIIYLIVILAAVPELFLPHADIEGTWSGMEMATMIFIFVCCLNSFKPSFKMFLANGVSRKTMFKSFITTIAIVVLVLTVIDSISSFIFSSVTNYNSMFYNIYSARYTMASAVSFQVSIEGILWRIFSYAAVGITGFFITVLYYRMDKPMKLLVSIGVPIFFFMILPYIDNMFCNGVIYDTIGYLIAKAGGFLDGYNPYIADLSNAIIFAVLSGLSYLLIRRATVKE